jgi:hypothetical protein
MSANNKNDYDRGSAFDVFVSSTFIILLGSLKIGDLILLKDVSRNIYLNVEGILQTDLCACDGTENILDNIFCVHLQRQYSASRDLSAFLVNYGNDPRSIVEESAKKYLLALQRGRENEKKLNDNYMKKKFGQKVSFGDIIQVISSVVRDIVLYIVFFVALPR